MTKIIGIKCKNKFFITKICPNNFRTYFFPENITINGNTVKKTFHPNWGIIEDEPKIVQKYVKQPNTNHRFELIDKTMESSKIKLVLKRDDVTEYNIEGGGLSWKNEYKIYQSLYKAASDEQPDILEGVEFKYKTIMEVNEIKEYKGFAYDVQKTKWVCEGLRKFRENEVQHQLIDRIVFPDILLPARPCSLTPKQSFDVVREYVKQNINYKVAIITSDYDFCFTVKKRILTTKSKKHIPNTTDSWLKRVECFNIAPQKYQDYNVIAGFRGKDQKDLKNNIDSYCKNLITFINKPLTKCPYCKGHGVVSEDPFTNKQIIKN